MTALQPLTSLIMRRLDQIIYCEGDGCALPLPVLPVPVPPVPPVPPVLVTSPHAVNVPTTSAIHSPNLIIERFMACSFIDHLRFQERGGKQFACPVASHTLTVLPLVLPYVPSVCTLPAKAAR